MTDWALKLFSGCYGDSLASGIDLLNASSHAVFAAHLSILSSLLETYLSVSVGASEQSMSLFGVATMSVLDLAGSLLVLYRWRFMSQTYTKKQIQRVESYFAVTIGVVMALLGVTLFQVSIVKLIVRQHPCKLGKGVLVALFVAISSFLLFVYKMKAGQVLQSLVLITASKCSLCVSLISLVVALALILEHMVWWSDGMMGLVVSVYVVHESYGTIRTTFDEMKGGPTREHENARLLKGNGEAVLDPETADRNLFDTDDLSDDPLTFTL